MVFKGPRQHWLYGQLLLEGKSGLAREGVFGCGQLCMYVPGETRCSVPPAALAVRQRPKILPTPHLYRLVKGADTPDARRH